MTKCVVGAGWLILGSYGCKQVMGWEEATWWGEGGSGGEAGQSSSSGGAGGMGGDAGAGGMAGMAGAGGIAGMGGAGGMGGGGAGGSGCMTEADCPAVANATRTCTNGVCGFTCNNGFGDCTAAAGCETVLTNNRNHCGACGNACAAYCAGTECNDPVSIAGGYHHHCAVMTNGDVYCWGRNEKGELGDGTLGSKPVPTKVKGLPGPAVQVDGGASATQNNYTPKTCAALVNGEVWCWGEGNGTPTKVGGLANIKEVSVGDAHLCAVSKTGTLYCWGSNSYGQVGDGGTGYAAVPVQITSNVLHISAGGKHTCAVVTGGALQCWGDNGDGQLGIGSFLGKQSPTVVEGIANVSAVRCANSHTCAFAGDALYCWGANQVGQLGTGNINSSSVPKAVNLPGVEAIAVSYNFSAAVTDGTLSMWGFNSSGQLGTGMTNTVYSPMAVALMDVQAIGLASTSSCALLKNREIRCWGANTYGQLGNGGIQQKLLPTLISWP
ncbi:MAG: hypothetical protein IPM54_44900 [Polyangiaceae bacterium]|nr:hypothetical protein [Polyangiaceae bacterium]